MSPPPSDSSGPASAAPRTSRSVRVYPTDALRVTFGVGQGETLGPVDEQFLDDVYELEGKTPATRLSLACDGAGQFWVGRDSQIGTIGARLFLDGALTMMPTSGGSVECILLVEVDVEGMIAGSYLLPLSQMQQQTGYRLVSISRDNAAERLAQMACVSFARGTHITLATGRQVPIETLTPGDRILTRDDGAQPLRWIGQSTQRATGAMAPVLIRAGALNNANDLLLSPAHRLMLYQRRDTLGLGAPEILVRAGDLVDGENVRLQEGGFVDYFQLLFDRHHLIYAEGIAAESLLLDPMTRAALPQDLMRDLDPDLNAAAQGIGIAARGLPAGGLPADRNVAGGIVAGGLAEAAQINHSPRQLPGTEVSRSQLSRSDILALLRRASSG